MRELEKRAIINGRVLSFEAMVEHASGECAIVLCRNESGELRYVTSAVTSIARWPRSSLTR